MKGKARKAAANEAVRASGQRCGCGKAADVLCPICGAQCLECFTAGGWLPGGCRR